MIARVLACTAFLASAGCSLNINVDCPDVSKCSLSCPGDRLAHRADGCAVCECASNDGASTTTVCWDDGDCGAGRRCDTVDFCEKAPNCTAGSPCPDACYGECVAAAATCASDSDCQAGQVCAQIQNGGGADRPTDPSGGGSSGGSGGGSTGGAPPPLPAPTGVCIDGTCAAQGGGQTNVAIPECPPGTEPGFDPSVDPCNPTCVAVDPCRGQAPDVCAATPGCAVVAGTTLCASIDDCASLDENTCESNPNCVLKPIGGTTSVNGNSGGTGSAPAPCDPTTDPSCSTNTPPPPSTSSTLVCVARFSDGTCFSDSDCLAGDTCQLTTLCGTGCTTLADGTQECFDSCWTDRGVCAPGVDSCATLGAADCTAANGCVVAGDACVPAAASCSSDTDCGAGQHCALSETCPPCNPQNGGDLNCAAPCFVEGTCIDGNAPPTPCNVDSDCSGAAGQSPSVCAPLTVCETCPKTPPSDANQPVAPCDPTCTQESVCEPLPESGTVGGGVPCASDADCASGQRCATELASPVCVDNTATSGTFCLSNQDCASQNESCRFDPDVCLQDPNNPSAANVCEGWCVGVCGNVVTSAEDPSTGQCKTFPDTCIPPGWQTVSSCPTTPPPP